ncbi:unnamed protein product [Ectocarpus sp. 6 AP-2014]
MGEVGGYERRVSGTAWAGVFARSSFALASTSTRARKIRASLPPLWSCHLWFEGDMARRSLVSRESDSLSWALPTIAKKEEVRDFGAHRMVLPPKNVKKLVMSCSMVTTANTCCHYRKVLYQSNVKWKRRRRGIYFSVLRLDGRLARSSSSSVRAGGRRRWLPRCGASFIEPYVAGCVCAGSCLWRRMRGRSHPPTL